MPSVILGNPPASGAQLVLSGNPWSGVLQKAGIQLFWVPQPGAPPRLGSGNCYIALSGGGPPLSGAFMTINSGAMLLSGGVNSGLLDGMCLGPGDRYFIPPSVIGNAGGTTSGTFNIYALCDQAASGIGRLYLEPFLGGYQ